MDTVCLEDSILDNLVTLIIAQLHLAKNQVKSNTPLIDLDMDSIDSAELALEIQAAFDIEISTGILGVIGNDKEMTVGKLSELIRNLIVEKK